MVMFVHVQHERLLLQETGLLGSIRASKGIGSFWEQIYP